MTSPDLIGHRVFIYKNLHKDCWSIQSREGENYGRVIAHADQAVVEGAEFKVQKAGRARVLETGRKNVHAGVLGRLVKLPTPTSNGNSHFQLRRGFFPVRYNPREAGYFQYGPLREEITKAKTVLLDIGTVWASEKEMRI